MLIRNLYYLYGNSESSNARLDSAIPNAIEEKAGTLIIPKRTSYIIVNHLEFNMI